MSDLPVIWSIESVNLTLDTPAPWWPGVGSAMVTAEPVAWSIVSAAPTVTITSPGSSISTTSVTVTWTSVDPLGRGQRAARIEIFRNGELLYVRTVDGPVTSHAAELILAPGSQYTVKVTAWANPAGNPEYGTAVQDFYVAAADLAEIPDNPDVGTLYEIAINGVPYMLADSPENPWRAQAGQLEIRRMVTTDTPFEQSYDRYDGVGWSDWSGGQGQKYWDRPSTDKTRFWSSRSVDPFTPGEVTTLRGTTSLDTRTLIEHPVPIVAMPRGWASVTAEGIVTYVDAGFGAGNIDTTQGWIHSLYVQDDVLYSADDAEVRTYDFTTSTDADWATLPTGAVAFGWTGDRFAALGTDSGARTATFTTYGSDGTEEESGGIQTFQHAAAIPGTLTGGSGHIWFGLSRSPHSEVWTWTLDSGAGACRKVFDIPVGERLYGLYYYQDNLFILTSEAGKGKLYRAVVGQAGEVVAQVIYEHDTAVGLCGFTAIGAQVFVVFSDGHAGENTMLAVDLATGGVAHAGATHEGFYPSIAASSVSPGAIFSSCGTTIELLRSPTADYQDGTLTTSLFDLGTSTTKVVEEVSIRTLPLFGGQSVDVHYTVDGGVTYTYLGTLSGAGAAKGLWPLSLTVTSFGLRLTLHADGTNPGPTLTLASARSRAGVLSDEIRVFPVNCSDRFELLNGSEAPNTTAGSGIRRAQTLVNMSGQTVKLQDVDWPLTQVSKLWQIVSVDATSTGVPDRHKGRRSDSAVAVVTLRRSGG